MSHTPFLFTTALFLFLLLLSPPLTTANDAPKTAYEIIDSYNLPMGLLPKGVIDYDLNTTTGKFHVYLNDSCSFPLESSYTLKYESTISGIISKNKLTDLEGVSVKVLFLWLDIVEVDRTGDELEFSVGITSASFPMKNFVECPQCGCGLDCNGVHTRKVKLDPFVYSSVF